MRIRHALVVSSAFLATLTLSATAQGRPGAGAPAGSRQGGAGPTPATFVSNLRFRNIGPASTGGRIGDIAIHPKAKSTWLVGVAYGGVWITRNAGTTWTPVFDGEGASSIGAVAIDPSDTLTMWVGTGENNSQRAIGYGDGIYKSSDGGRSWTNMGLKTSNHIGMIKVDPRNSNVVYVAAMGPLWSSGGERGLYKTTDGGKTWEQVLTIDAWTGVYEVHLDPRNPDVLYASSYQRQRRQWTMINGGPGSGIWKSVDAGKTWRRLTRGLPGEELGKIGMAIAPSRPDVVYAIVEAARGAGGFYRSSDAGASWQRMSATTAGPPFYYHELTADPINPDRVYSMDVNIRVTNDGGATFSNVPGRDKHVDNQALWIDPDNTNHMVSGNDGGLYTTWDGGDAWLFHGNLPISQFYKIDLDNALPFYNVYGGLQDNNTVGGPSATLNSEGIHNQDWFITSGGDGFQPRVDPTDPNIVYSESQHGELSRFDRKTGNRINIQPQPEPGDSSLRWHWDSPLIISPHSHTRLYFAANKLFRSDDRGDSWQQVSPDLSRQIDRNRLPMFGRVQSIDAVARNTSTSLYGSIVSLAESPMREGMLVAGTDDGLLHVSEDGGGNWRATATFPGVPEFTFVSDVEPSRHAAATIYATFNNHKSGDYKPYVLKSTDGGRSWTSITGNLPERGSTWTIAEDHVDPNLLFVGTEFGAFFSQDGGQRWAQFRGGLPNTPVRDIAIHRRENDLVLGTFGRGIWILDDYTSLRSGAIPAGRAAAILPIRDAKMFVAASPIGSPGASFFTASNPEFGAVFTYYLRDALRTREAVRRDAERTAARDSQDIPFPSWEALRAEDREEAPSIVLTITDSEGNIIRKLNGRAAAGISRVTWNFRYPSLSPITSAAGGAGFGGGGGGGGGGGFGGGGGNGPIVPPGTYRVSLASVVDGVTTELVPPVSFRAVPITEPTIPVGDRTAIAEFHLQAARLQRVVQGATQAMNETESQLGMLRRALDQTPTAPAALMDTARALTTRLLDLRIALSGDPTLSRRQEPDMTSMQDRLGRIVGGTWSTTMAPTQTHRRQYEIVSTEFAAWLPRLRAIVEQDLPRLAAAAEAAGAPWTPGRAIPRWP